MSLLSRSAASLIFLSLISTNLAYGLCDDGTQGVIKNGYEYCKATSLPTQALFTQKGHGAGGNGCPQNSYVIQPSPDGTGLSVFFDQFKTTLTTKDTVNSIFSACNLSLRTFIPSGHSYNIVSTSSVGYYQLKNNGTAVAQINQVYFSGSFSSNRVNFISAVKMFDDGKCYKGKFALANQLTLALDYNSFSKDVDENGNAIVVPCISDLQENESFGVTSSISTACGTREAQLNIRMQNVAQRNSLGKVAEIGVDLFDVGLAQKSYIELVAKDTYYCKPYKSF